MHLRRGIRPASPFFRSNMSLTQRFQTTRFQPSDVQDQAVAPGQGGIISREDAPAAAASAMKALPSGKPPPARLCVVDPLTGRDVAGGVHRIAQASRADACVVLWGMG